MFGWFKRKPKTEAALENTVPAMVTPDTVASVARQTVSEAVAEPVAEVPQAAPEPTPQAPKNLVAAIPLAFAPPQLAELAVACIEPEPRQIGRAGPSRLRVLKTPRPGEQAVQVVQKRHRPAEIVKTQASGRRVLARLADCGRIYAYTRRADGTFRLEQAPTSSSVAMLITESG